jgi:hypothetical protein
MLAPRQKPYEWLCMPAPVTTKKQQTNDAVLSANVLVQLWAVGEVAVVHFLSSSPLHFQH